MIRNLQFRCSKINKFCEQPHNSNCCKMVFVDDPNGHYRDNCWYPNVEISGIKFSEDGVLWFPHDNYTRPIIPIPGDWRSYVLKGVYPPDTSETFAELAEELQRQQEKAEQELLQQQEESKIEYEVHHGVRRRIK